MSEPRVGDDLAARVLAGDLRALARALTVVENDEDGGAALLQALQALHGVRGARTRDGLPGSASGGTPGSARAHAAHRIGVTGPPGAGKSTLVSALTAHWRKAGKRVGVLAVDPSSPFSGGALLGDRVRMTQHLGDAGVFVRSLASRGASGGLAAATEDAADLLEAAGFNPVVLETVGVGQAELDVAHAADTVVVVLAPGSGDEVQAMKAGLLEVADVVVVNQADHAGADRLEAALKAAFELRTGDLRTRDLRAGRASPPLFPTVATTGQGVEALGAALDVRAADAAGPGSAARRLARARRRVVAEVERGLARSFWAGREAALEAAARAVAEGTETARDAAARLTGSSPTGMGPTGARLTAKERA